MSNTADPLVSAIKASIDRAVAFENPSLPLGVVAGNRLCEHCQHFDPSTPYVTGLAPDVQLFTCRKLSERHLTHIAVTPSWYCADFAAKEPK